MLDVIHFHQVQQQQVGDAPLPPPPPLTPITILPLRPGSDVPASPSVQSSVRALRVAGQEIEAVFRPASWATSNTVGTFTVWSLSNTESPVSATGLPEWRSR